MNKSRVPKKTIGSTFSEKVIKFARMIPPGRVITYGRLAKAAGSNAPMAAQSVTRILSRAYDSGIKDIPFHRIVYANGKVWMNNEYSAKRKKLYKQEGIELDKNGKIVDFQDRLV